jgi:hypothetical protein
MSLKACRSSFPRLVIACALVLVAKTVSAAPIATLSFTTPAGIVGPNDAIPVFLTLTLDPSSSALTTDGAGQITSGLDPGDIPPGFTVDNSWVNVFFQCSGTFTTSCTTGPPYDFDFQLGPGSLVFPQNLNLQPGDSLNFLFGTFSPSAGPVAPGTYTFFNAGVTVNFSGTDIDGNPDEVNITFGQTCPTQSAGCAFTRTVIDNQTTVPEPTTMVLFGTGLGLAAIRRRLRNKR